MTSVKIIISVLMFSVLMGLTSSTKTLKMVHLLYRHGDRGPISGFPNDIHKENAWPNGYGQLTQVGMRMEYNLGKFLRSRYIENSSFLSNLYLHEKVHVRSSNSDRCLMSAETQLAGLYPPYGYQIWNKVIPWQPIPVHTVPGDSDPMLRPWDCHCPQLEKLKAEKQLRKEFISVVDRYQKFFNFLSKKTGLNVTYNNIWMVADTIYCEQQHKMKVVGWCTPEVIADLTFLNKFDMSYMKTGNAEYSRLTGGPLLAEIVTNMKLLTTGKGDHVPILNIYSAHDTTLIPLLSALGVYNGIPPPYAAAVLVELYQDLSKNYTIEIYYRNDSTKQAYRLSHPNCPAACPVNDFYRLTKDRVSVNRKEECNIETEFEIIQRKTTYKYLYDNMGVLVGFSIVVVFLFIIVFALYLQCRKKSEITGYSSGHIRQYNFQDTDEEEGDSIVLLKNERNINNL